MLKPNCTLSVFHDRLELVIPNISGFRDFKTSPDISKILKSLLVPLNFDNKTIPSDALWWFRGEKSMHILGFDEIGANHYILDTPPLCSEEILVDKLTVYVDRSQPDLSFVYLHCAPLSPAFDEGHDLEYQSSTSCYSEEVGYIREHNFYIDASKAYDGEPVEVNGQLVHADTITTRYLSVYNIFVAPKESRLNNTSGDPGELLGHACNRLLTGEMSIKDFPTYLSKFPISGFRSWLMQSSDS